MVREALSSKSGIAILFSQITAKVIRFRPFDQRSVPLFCYQCFRPGHRKGDCHNSQRCGRCAGPHEVWGCETPRVRCPNCDEGHEAWSLNCKNTQVETMRNECTCWRKRGPGWAPRQELLPLSSHDRGAHKSVKTAKVPHDTAGRGFRDGNKDTSQKRKLSPQTAMESHLGPSKHGKHATNAAVSPGNLRRSPAPGFPNSQLRDTQEAGHSSSCEPIDASPGDTNSSAPHKATGNRGADPKQNHQLSLDGFITKSGSQKEPENEDVWEDTSDFAA